MTLHPTLILMRYLTLRSFLLYCLCLIIQQCTNSALSGVFFCAEKDLEVLESSVRSSVKHLPDVKSYYIVVADSVHSRTIQKNLTVDTKITTVLSEKSLSSHSKKDVLDAMQKVMVKHSHVDKNTQKNILQRGGWIWQQFAKLWARQLIGFGGDYVVIDSDVVWLKDVQLIDRDHCESLSAAGANQSSGSSRIGAQCRYLYATSNQYHEAYLQSVTEILGLDFSRATSQSSGSPVWRKGQHVSGISHHMVFSGAVLDSLYAHSQSLPHNTGLDFFEIFVKVGTERMLCGMTTRCSGGTSSISEYELYFQYARFFFPRTVGLRPLMWANGPAPGLVFRPTVMIKSAGGKVTSDLFSVKNWVSKSNQANLRRSNGTSDTFEIQKLLDAASGFDFVAYHLSAPNRRYEIRARDRRKLCKVDREFLHCFIESHRDIDWRVAVSREKDAFRDCACFYANTFGK